MVQPTSLSPTSRPLTDPRHAMKSLALALAAPALALAAAPKVLAPTTAAQPHCQVPCGIYGDRLRVELLREDFATIEKAMAQLRGFQAEESPNLNQVVRWTTTKDEHAQKIQDQVMDYWLSQRVKIEYEKSVEGAKLYHDKLTNLHWLAVYAMRSKQTTDAKNVQGMRDALDAFSELYFSKEDLDHLRGHHDGDKR